MKSQYIIKQLQNRENNNSYRNQNNQKQNNDICYELIIPGFQAMESVK